MPWSAGSYSKGNNATGGWVGDASLGIGIEAGRHDTQDNDFATGINQCLNKDGSNAATGNLNLGGFLPTNIGAGTAAAPALCMNNDTNTGLFSPAADQIGIATNGTERVRISDTGRVGIGTTAPGATLDAQSALGDQLLTRFSADAGSASINLRKSRGASVGTNTIVQNGDEIGAIGFQGANGTGYTPAAAIYAFVDGTPGATNDMPGRLAFYTTADGAGSWTERMRIDSSGRVGIGAPSTGARLLVAAQGTGGAATEFLQIAQTAAADNVTSRIAFYNYSGIAGAIDSIQNAASNFQSQLVFSTQTGSGMTEKMRITAGGNVGIGGNTASAYKLYVKSEGTTGSSHAIVCENSVGASLFGVLSDGGFSTGTAGNSPYNLTTGNAANVYVESNGILFRSTSSLKYKQDIEDMSYGLNEALQVRPVTFAMKGSDGQRRFAGLIAEDIDALGMTEFVQYANDETPDAINYANMVALSFKAIQELNAKVESLEARVAELEA